MSNQAPIWDLTIRRLSTKLVGMTNATQFWSKVDKRGPDDCWPWLASTRSQGHGQIKWRGRVRSAMAVALELAGKRQPKGTYALHHCNYPPCVNPKHGFWGTQGKNIRMSVEFGTHRNTRKTHCIHGHELTEANVYRRASAPHKRECRICRINRHGK